MKKYAGYFLVAVLGGLISLGGFALLQKNTENLKGVPQPSTPVQFTSLTGLPSSNPDFTAAANTSIHAVVHVKTEYAQKNSMYDNFFNFHDFFGDSPYGQQGPLQGAGSGVIISPDGYIVTNNHVVQDATKIEIVLNDKRSFEGTVVGTDPSTDLAVVKIKESNLPFLSYGNSDELQIGEWVLAVGNPFNLTSTVTAGIVSAKARNINILGTPDGTSNSIESFIQTDAAVNRGNSGGALVNTRGELVGINAAIASGNGFYAGYSFAIPVNIVKKVVGDLIDYREVQRAFLGVSIRDIDSKLASEQGMKELRGVYVAEVNDGSAAKEAGIKKGDVITSVNKITVNSTSELLEQISRYHPGEKVTVGVSRDGADQIYNVTLLNRSGTTSLVKNEPKDIMPMLGAKIQVASGDVLRKLGLDHGVQVVELEDGLLRNAGVREGYVITEIDKKPIRNLDDMNKILANKSGGILLEGVYPNRVRAYYGFGIN